MELLEGHLRVHLDLGTGPVNVRASRLPLNDGQWHHVELNLKRSMGRVAVDGQDESFETPGKCKSCLSTCAKCRNFRKLASIESLGCFTFHSICTVNSSCVNATGLGLFHVGSSPHPSPAFVRVLEVCSSPN